MSLSQGQLDSLTRTGLIAVAHYKLGYLTISGQTVEQFAASLADAGDAVGVGIEEVLRRILWPFLEPVRPTGPYTVYTSVDPVAEGDLVAAAQTNAGLSEETYGSTEEALRACAAVWFA